MLFVPSPRPPPLLLPGRFFSFFVPSLSVDRLLIFDTKVITTSNGGPLGSCIDEERSKLRYLV